MPKQIVRKVAPEDLQGQLVDIANRGHIDAVAVVVDWESSPEHELLPKQWVYIVSTEEA